MESRNESSRFSVLMMPWLAHGHISPFQELAKRLAHKNFRIYLCSTPINLNSIKKKITQNYSLSIQLVELHLPSLPNLPPHYHTTNGLPPHLMTTLKYAFDMSKPAFSNILETVNPDLLIYDFNQPWAATIASSHKIPCVQFLTAAAAILSFGLHMLTNPVGEKFPFPEIYLREYEITRMREAVDSSSKDAKDTDRFLEGVNGPCGIILIKSFREIEGKYIDFFSQLVGKKAVPVGPLVQESFEEDASHGEILKWLEKKDECSAIFVSFGSEYFLSKEEIEELAYGLELSNVNFIWVVRFPEGQKFKVEEVLPDGFFERVGERGLIVENWAPQTKILGHSSTGGFVSHCGWNSVMESIKYGVPIIATPMHLDQPINARLVTEVGAGMEVVRDKTGKLRREEIADVIRKVMLEKSGEKLREKTRELSEILRIKGDEEIDGVAEELVQICQEKKSNRI